MASRYDGPSTLTRLTFGTRSIAIVHPAEPDRLLNDPLVLELNRQHDYMPYWAYLWPGAYLLAEAVAREVWEPGTKALEIGCGLGLGGLVGASGGLDVVFSDYDETALEYVKASWVANDFPPAQLSTQLLDWERLPQTRYPVILGADVLYERRLVPLVCDLIAQMLSPGGTAWIAGPYRVATESLDAALASRGLIARSEPISSHDSVLGALHGTLHRIRRKS